jgi:hypothetical protein
MGHLTDVSGRIGNRNLFGAKRSNQCIVNVDEDHKRRRTGFIAVSHNTVSELRYEQIDPPALFVRTHKQKVTSFDSCSFSVVEVSVCGGGQQATTWPDTGLDRLTSEFDNWNVTHCLPNWAITDRYFGKSCSAREEMLS